MSLHTLKTNAKINVDNDWYTPLYIIEFLENNFNLKINYDPATTEKLSKYHNIEFFDNIYTNGLLQDWRSFKNIYINPPFALKKDFIVKGYNQILSEKSLIENIFIIVPIESLTNLNTFNFLSKKQDNIFTNLIVPKGRIKFVKRENGEEVKKSPFFSSLIIHISKKYNYNLKWVDMEKVNRKDKNEKK